MNPITELCRKLRTPSTFSENKLWAELRRRNISDVKFLRQYPIFYAFGVERFFYIADFYCAKHKLVIEVDGPIHEFKKEYDKNRDIVMRELGLNILRFKNDEVLNDIKGVVERIEQAVSHPTNYPL
ncbi:endonuclease domain-containing protein [Mucilaginibacter myungsuensis]|nr:endonuclease domain-containing protein [Mucilaginibacter myungsuensis]MDN3597149.1 endonuclease domain-containing protein [Mucilaginibacter myungsuensis]